jgi:DNA-directed RNA polymerase specialized sigma24 family protein
MKINVPSRPETMNNNARKSPGLAYDCELAARLKDGDRNALRQLVERHVGRVRTYLLHRLGEGNDQSADRVLAATFNDALRHINPYANGSATTPMEFWLISLAEKNLKRLGSDPKSASPPASTKVPPDSDLARFRAALTAIPDRFRAVLVLAVIEQMPASEIAQCLGVSPASAMRRLREALKQLGAALEKQETH